LEQSVLKLFPWSPLCENCSFFLVLRARDGTRIFLVSTFIFMQLPSLQCSHHSPVCLLTIIIYQHHVYYLRSQKILVHLCTPNPIYGLWVPYGSPYLLLASFSGPPHLKLSAVPHSSHCLAHTCGPYHHSELLYL
jgi:hypothetical protein